MVKTSVKPSSFLPGLTGHVSVDFGYILLHAPLKAALGHATAKSALVGKNISGIWRRMNVSLDDLAEPCDLYNIVPHFTPSLEFRQAKCNGMQAKETRKMMIQLGKDDHILMRNTHKAMFPVHSMTTKLSSPS